MKLPLTMGTDAVAWHITGADDQLVAYSLEQKDAAIIVRAVNAFEQLRDACEHLVRAANDGYITSNHRIDTVIEIASAALDLADKDGGT